MTTAAAISNQSPRTGRSSYLTLLTAFLLNLPALAQPAATSSVPTVPDRSREEQPELIDEFDRVRFNNASSSHYFNNLNPPSEPDYFFFPPVPPPLDSELHVLPPFVPGVAAPPELAPFVGDCFYPLLGARLAADDLPKAIRMRLQSYRAARVALQNELRARIAELKDTDPAGRERQLAAFAVRQTSGIVALEVTAEKIREDLLHTGLLGLPAEAGDWSRSPAWRQPAPVAPPDLQRESRAVWGAAFYAEGLSPAQRRLLCEEAVDLETQAEPVLATAPAAEEAWLLDFSPETARIRILANLPAPLARTISEYVSRKGALKAELLEALRRYADTDGDARTEAMKQLAAAQAPRCAGLEVTAEEIRRELAALPNPPGPPAPPALPPELMARISSYRAHKLELFKTLYALLVGAPDPAHPIPVLANQQAGEPAEGDPAWLHGGATPTPVRPTNLRVSVDEFNRRQSALVGELNLELAGIREALSEYVRAANPPTDRKSINDLLNDFEQARQKQEIWDKYRDYQAAVLLPGLSPEQRRLLFNAAVEQLGLPLPAAARID